MKAAGRQNYRPRLITALIVVLIVTSGLLYVILEVRNNYPNPSSQNQCGLFATAMQTNFVENAESTNFVGLNESAPPWNYQSVYDNVQQGWQSICQSQTFSELVQAHGSAGFSASFGYSQQRRSSSLRGWNRIVLDPAPYFLRLHRTSGVVGHLHCQRNGLTCHDDELTL